MAAGVSVRCPVCRSVGRYVPPALPCACGQPVTPALVDGAEGIVLEHRTWAEDWIAVRCRACDRTDHWPYPELACSCGVLLRVAVGAGERGGGPVPSRTPFRPVPIADARGAVTAAALYLGWLGYGEIRRAEEPPPHGVALAAKGLLAHIEPTPRQVRGRDVECLWLASLAASVAPVGFTLGGPSPEAAQSAEELGVPLFHLQRSGEARPCNPPADRLAASGGK
ncbi:hypothetical protein AB0J21_16590 [Streptomyces sp. NPDC049954]|uniref:hypothetical protein n=1 Tax=Streptomyces sp. NPDC049954 TaxID=3155779 RepID=UPI003431F271